jgi:hypothetical protein
MGLGGQEAAGKVVTVQAELPHDVDGILDAIRNILLMGEVQTIALVDGQPITYKRFVRHGEELKPSESTQSFAELTPFEIVRNVQMEEWEEEGKRESKTPADMLLRMIHHMGHYGWVVTHILLSERSPFWLWLGLPSALEQFVGARVEVDKKMPTDVFILCGARSRGATIAEVGFALKGTAHEP